MCLHWRDGLLSLGDSRGDDAPGIPRIFDKASHEEVTERHVE